MNKLQRLLYLTLLTLIFTSSCAKNPYYDDALFLFDSGNYSRAAQELNYAQQLEPLRVDIKLKLAEALTLAKREDQSLKVYLGIQLLAPNNQIANAKIANYLKKSFAEATEYTEKAEYTEAYDKYKKILETDPANLEAAIKMNKLDNFFLKEGNKHFKNGEKDDAAYNYSQYLEISPYKQSKLKNREELSKHYSIKASKTESSDTYKAMDDYELALSFDIYNDSMLYRLGKLYSNFSEFRRETYESFKKAIVLNPSISKYHFYLGFQYLKNGRTLVAKREYLRSVELLKKEIESNIYNKKKYKYFFDSIKALTPTKNGLKESKGKEAYIPLKDKKNLDLGFNDENIKSLKVALELLTQIDDFFERLKDIDDKDFLKKDDKDSDKYEVAKDFNLLLTQIGKDKEDLDKEKEFFATVQKKMKNGDKKLVDLLTKIGKIIEAI